MKPYPSLPPKKQQKKKKEKKLKEKCKIESLVLFLLFAEKCEELSIYNIKV
jgi:hypothetical protein